MHIHTIYIPIPTFFQWFWALGCLCCYNSFQISHNFEIILWDFVKEIQIILQKMFYIYRLYILTVIQWTKKRQKLQVCPIQIYKRARNHQLSLSRTFAGEKIRLSAALTTWTYYFQCNKSNSILQHILKICKYFTFSNRRPPFVMNTNYEFLELNVEHLHSSLFALVSIQWPRK